MKCHVYETSCTATWGSGMEVTLKNADTIKVATKEALGDPVMPLSPSDFIDKASMFLTHTGLTSPARLIDEILVMANNGPAPILPLEKYP